MRYNDWKMSVSQYILQTRRTILNGAHVMQQKIYTKTTKKKKKRGGTRYVDILDYNISVHSHRGYYVMKTLLMNSIILFHRYGCSCEKYKEDKKKKIMNLP